MKTIRRQCCCPPGSSSSSILPTIPSGPRAPSRMCSTPSPCPRSPSAATTTRKICTGRRKSTQSSSRTTQSTRTSSCSAPGVTAIGRRPSRALGNLDYGEPIGTEFRAQHRSEIFRALSQRTSPASIFENTASFQTGSNTWQYYAHFPPAESQPTSLISQGAGLLSWSASTAAGRHQLRERPRQPRSLPPSPHPAHLLRRLAVVQLAHRRPALRHRPQRRRRLEAARPHAKTSPSPAKSSPTSSPPPPAATTTWSSSSSTSTPTTIPTRRCAAISSSTNAEIFRGRYLSGFDHPTALAPGSIHEYKFSLHDVDHVFKAGHTVMVEIQSTWFPLYDRNPQTFVPNIMKAKPGDYKAATITIYSGAGHESALELPVMKP